MVSVKTVEVPKFDLLQIKRIFWNIVNYLAPKIHMQNKLTDIYVVYFLLHRKITTKQRFNGRTMYMYVLWIIWRNISCNSYNICRNKYRNVLLFQVVYICYKCIGMINAFYKIVQGILAKLKDIIHRYFMTHYFITQYN